MKIRILGPLEVQESGHRLNLGGPQQRAVLAMLALHANRVLAVDDLVAGIWGDEPPDRAVNTLQAYVSRLRRLGDGIPVSRRGPGYVLDADEQSLDLIRFRTLVESAGRARPISAEDAAALLRQASDLWRSPPLQEFAELPFARAEAAALDQERLTALTARISADLSLGRATEVIGELRGLTGEHPTDESLHGQFALALYRCGRQADALAVLRDIRRRLTEDVGVDPGRELQNLERAILAHEPGLTVVRPAGPVLPAPRTSPESGPAAPPPAGPTPEAARPEPKQPTRAPVAWNVPARNPHFTGRTTLLDAIHSQLSAQRDTVAVQTLYGLGGVGKTHLAIEFAHRFAPGYSVVWWINAEEPSLIPDQLARLNHRLGLPGRAAVDEMVDQVLQRLGEQSDWLLIFDNAGQVDDVAPYRPYGGGHILVTSRNPRWGEIGGRTLVEVLDRLDSVEFIRSRMPGLRAELADELAAELGDLPLAMAQAVAYVEETGVDPAEYLAQFSRRRSAFLARGRVLGYQARLDTAWDLSLHRLAVSSPESLSLLELSAYLSSEPIPAAIFADRPELLRRPAPARPADSARADPADRAVESTVDGPDLVERAMGGAAGLSLIRRQRAGFQVHRLVQAVIRAHLTPDERDRVAAAAAGLIAGANPGDPSDPRTWPAYRRLVPHVFALGGAADQLAPARRMMLDTIVYLNGTAPPRWTGELARRVFDRWAHLLGDDHPDTLAVATFVVHSSIWAGNPREARELGLRSLPLAQRTLGADHPMTLRLAGYLAVALTWTADVKDGRTLALDTIDRARQTFAADDPDLIRIVTTVTLALGWIGDPAMTELAVDVHEIARRVLGPDHPTTLLAGNEVIFGLLTAGDTAAIRVLGEDLLARSREVVGDHHHITVASASLLALGLVWDGDTDRAAELGEQFLARRGAGLGTDHLITLTVAAATASIRACRPEPPDSADVPELATALRMPGPDHPITLALTTAAARLAERVGRPGAHARLADAIARVRRNLGPGHPLAGGYGRRLTSVG